jgi:sugar lactone lactonase YvrE
MEITPLIKDFKGKSFLGPNSIILDDEKNCLYFTDSGPMGETTLENPRGSIYKADLDTMEVKPLATSCLAHPSGIAKTATGLTIFVSETMQNRIIRITEHEGSAQ